jgi:hypothetical protein
MRLSALAVRNAKPRETPKLGLERELLGHGGCQGNLERARTCVKYTKWYSDHGTLRGVSI